MLHPKLGNFQELKTKYSEQITKLDNQKSRELKQLTKKAKLAMIKYKIHQTGLAAIVVFFLIVTLTSCF